MPRLRRPLQDRLEGAAAEKAAFHEWRALRDDGLLAEAAKHGCTTPVATAKRMEDEQRHSAIAIVAVDDNRVSRLTAAVRAIAEAIRATRPGESRIVAVADPRR